ncbi:hypothetical protein V1477_019934 [Vespula maculifrons]|uniref:Uncharacterized protein n=1 Tax=Vespula maculifrons TaxID=7453 RepID=A0ABD2AKH0_VESMC
MRASGRGARHDGTVSICEPTQTGSPGHSHAGGPHQAVAAAAVAAAVAATTPPLLAGSVTAFSLGTSLRNPSDTIRTGINRRHRHLPRLPLAASTVGGTLYRTNLTRDIAFTGKNDSTWFQTWD